MSRPYQACQTWVLVPTAEIHAQGGYTPFAWGMFFSKEAAEEYRTKTVIAGAARNYIVMPVVIPIDYS